MLGAREEMQCGKRGVVIIGLYSKLLLLSEEHAETDDGAVNQQSTDYTHRHSLDGNRFRVGENDRQCCIISVSIATREAPMLVSYQCPSPPESQ